MEDNELFMGLGILAMFIAPFFAYLFPNHYDWFLKTAQAYFERKRAREEERKKNLPK